MGLIEGFVRNPVKIAVAVLLLCLFGGIGLMRMPMQLTPEVQTPTLTIETRWPGASPQEVEREIIIEQEEQLKSVEGIRKLSSSATDSMGTITMEFIVGTDMDEALLKVNSRLQQVREYPEEADQPVISTSNSSDRPIAWFILSPRRTTDEVLAKFQTEHPPVADRIARIRATDNVGLALLRLRQLAKEYPAAEEILPPDIDVPKLRRFAEDEIEAMFERVDGVSASNVLGGLEDELQVIVDPQRLASRQLTIDDVRRVLREQNNDISGGDVWEGKRRYVIRTLGKFNNPEQVENQLLAVRDGRPVFLRDVAEVELGYKKPDGFVRRFGEAAIAVNALRETGANVLEVMRGLQEVNAGLNEGVLATRGLQLTQVYDETEYIHSSVGLVRQNIFIGSALTMAVLMLYLHLGLRTLLFVPLVLASAIAAVLISPWFFVATIVLILTAGFWFARGALVVGLAIPISIIGTFLILAMLGRSLNVISLAGMAFAIGMLVDNAVVVLESIYAEIEKGRPVREAVVRGATQVFGAVVASTLTTIAVFLPVVFVQEEAGQLFRDIALAISAAVGLSLLVSVTVIPVASSRLFKRRTGSSPATTERGAATRLEQSAGLIQRSASRFRSLVVGINAWLQHGMVRRLGFVGTVLAVTVGLTFLFWPKVEYLPVGNRNLVFGLIFPPPGYSLEMLGSIGEGIEQDLRPWWDTEPGQTEIEGSDIPPIGDFFYVARGKQVFLGLRAADPTRAGELEPLVGKVSSKIPGAFAIGKQSSLFEQGLTAGRTIDVEISGPELAKLIGIGGQLFGQIMQKLPEGTRAIPKPSLDLAMPELHIKPKLLQAADMGVATATLGYAVDALIDGAYASDYYIGGDKIDLVIKGGDEFSQRTQDVATLPIAVPSGQLIPLNALADVEFGNGPEQINHRERQRAITIEVSPPRAMPLQEAMESIQGIVAELEASGAVDGNTKIELSGTADKLKDTWTALRFNVLLALLITYLLMAALYESWVYPFVIILTVPLGAVGGLLGLALLNVYLAFVLKQPPQTLDVLTMLGFIVLIGTVVNNAILIVDQSLILIREESRSAKDAVTEAVRTRIRPIFMTTTTTVFGLMPLVLFPGAGSELYRGLGSVVLGGLLVSTLFTLFMIPTVFTLMYSATSRISSVTDADDDERQNSSGDAASTNGFQTARETAAVS